MLSSYYTCIIVLCIFSMGIMIYCTAISGVLDTGKKQLFCVLFGIVMVSAFCEWLGLALQRSATNTRELHIAVKALELSIAPCIGLVIALILGEPRGQKPMAAFLAVHAVLECLSGWFGFIYYVDETNYYYHTEFYWLYVLAYVASILYAFFAVGACMRKYQYNGFGLLVVLSCFMLCGIVMQLYNSDWRVDWITLGITSTLLYIFNSEMIQQTDAVTFLLHSGRFCVIPLLYSS